MRATKVKRKRFVRYSLTIVILGCVIFVLSLILVSKSEVLHIRSGQIKLSPDGKNLAGISERGVEVWDVSSNHLQNQRLLQGFKNDFWWRGRLAWSSDGNYIAFAKPDGSVDVVLWPTGIKKFSLRASDKVVSSVNFNPDSSLLVTTDLSQEAKVWSLANGTLNSKVVTGHKNLSNAIFNKNNLLAVTDSSLTVSIVNIQSSEIQELKDISLTEIDSITFSKNGNFVAAGDYNGVIRVWDVRDKSLIQTIADKSGVINCLTFGPNDEFIVSATTSADMLEYKNNDNTVHLWQIKDGILLRSLTGHVNNMLSLDFNSSNGTLASSNLDETIRLWTLS